MPIVFPLDDEVVKAIGRMTIWFAELEYFLNCCLFLFRDFRTETEWKECCKPEYQKRAKELKDIIKTQSAPGGRLDNPFLARHVQFRSGSVDLGDRLAQLGDRRNVFIHGVLRNVLQKDGQQLVARYYKYSSRSKKHEPFELNAIDALTAEIEKVAERLESLARDLDLQRQQRDKT
jgi:hypothetical protein